MNLIITKYGFYLKESEIAPFGSTASFSIRETRGRKTNREKQRKATKKNCDILKWAFFGFSFANDDNISPASDNAGEILSNVSL